MTNDQKYLVNVLLQGNHYLKVNDLKVKKKAWRLMDKSHHPESYVSKAAVKYVWAVLKKDKNGHYTLKLSLVRKESGKTYIKQRYRYQLKVNRIKSKNTSYAT